MSTSESGNENNSDIKEAWGIGCSLVIQKKNLKNATKKRYTLIFSKNCLKRIMEKSLNEKILLT